VASVNNNDISENLFESALHDSDLLIYAINSIDDRVVAGSRSCRLLHITNRSWQSSYYNWI